MIDEEKLTLIQKYEELPAEEFKEECFEDLKSLPLIKMIQSKLLLPVYFHVL